ncbi:unnamed protein product [Cylicostephanus goldi]|uniref:Uncharacterized protein n=1 Tax=Cylicostephanus goldi TaxID=71465 RepID=A0A3P6U0V1_CYLGO|nr:unnamed protein product [Cylicostephanus goldi]
MTNIPAVIALFLTTLCVTAPLKSLLDNLEDGHPVCSKDFEEDETMADFRQFAYAPDEVERFLGKKLV